MSRGFDRIAKAAADERRERVEAERKRDVARERNERLAAAMREPRVFDATTQSIVKWCDADKPPNNLRAVLAVVQIEDSSDVELLRYKHAGVAGWWFSSMAAPIPENARVTLWADLPTPPVVE